MKYLIKATVNMDPRNFQALMAMIMEKSEKVEVEQITNGELDKTKTTKLVRWPSTVTIKVGKEPLKETSRGVISLNWEVWTYLKKKYGTSSFVKGNATLQAKKDFANSKTFKASSVSPVITNLLDGGYLVKAD